MEIAQNGVCAVIVAFRPKVEDLGNLAEVRPQVQHLVVVDNGSAEETLKSLRTASRVLKFVLIENGENLVSWPRCLPISNTSKPSEISCCLFPGTRILNREWSGFAV
jgi:hypothetical protein